MTPLDIWCPILVVDRHFFDQNGLENHFFKTITNYIFLERYCYIDFRCGGIFDIFGHLGSWRAVLHQNGLENRNSKKMNDISLGDGGG